ncbi:MAG: exosortase N [Cytophagales bacterium]|nr:exosortase N [Cytophagales bacterium]
MKKYLLPLFFLLMAGLSFLFLENYFITQTSTILGFCILPYTLSFEKQNKSSFRYLFALLPLLIFTFFVPVKSLYFFSLCLSFVLLIEIWIGKTNHLPLFLLLLLSPAVIYFRSIIGVNIRLFLGELAGQLLNMANLEIEVHGNSIIYAQDTFSIDPACMGLSMLVHSFLLGIFILAYFQRKTQQTLNFWKTSLLLFILLLLNVTSNLIRIICLILFKIYPELLSHDVIGIVCLIIYVLIPFYFFSKLSYRYFTTPLNQEKDEQNSIDLWAKVISIGVFVILVGLGIHIKQHFKGEKIIPATCKVNGCEKELVTKDVLRFKNENVLIYVKPIPHFYSAEHNPLICWNGSGYQFKQIQKKEINGVIVYTAILEKEGKTMFYSSWWFDNGVHKTTSQWDWRINAIKTKTQYSLINVNTIDSISLEQETKRLLKLNIFGSKK